MNSIIINNRTTKNTKKIESNETKSVNRQLRNEMEKKEKLIEQTIVSSH